MTSAQSPDEGFAARRKSWRIAAQVLLVVSCATAGFAVGAYLAAPRLWSAAALRAPRYIEHASGLWGLPLLPALAVGGLIGAAIGALLGLAAFAGLRRFLG